LEPFLTDSHVHLDSFAGKGELYDVLNRAWTAGVHRMIAIGGTPEANRLVVKLVAEHPHCLRGAVGFDRDLAGHEASLEELEAMVGDRILAIGETGIDYHYLPETAPQQKLLFSQMLALAARHGLPTVIHSREADDDTIAILKDHIAAWKGDPARIGVLHCFTGTMAFARRLLDLGLLISFSGIVTFRNADSLREVALFVPEDRILVETDAPYLAPVPLRGKTNEPAFVTHVAQALATVRKVTLQHIAQQTTRNAAKLFGWPGESSA
jgi:TatD DNase family protein